MFCKNCGQQMADNTNVCPQCGTPTGNTPAYTGPLQYSTPNLYPSNTNDAPSTGFAVLGFFLPFVGLILYLVWKNTKPRRAHSVGKGALIGFIAGVVLY